MSFAITDPFSSSVKLSVIMFIDSLLNVKFGLDIVIPSPACMSIVPPDNKFKTSSAESSMLFDVTLNTVPSLGSPLNST